MANPVNGMFYINTQTQNGLREFWLRKNDAWRLMGYLVIPEGSSLPSTMFDLGLSMKASIPILLPGASMSFGFSHDAALTIKQLLPDAHASFGFDLEASLTTKTVLVVQQAFGFDMAATLSTATQLVAVSDLGFDVHADLTIIAQLESDHGFGFAMAAELQIAQQLAAEMGMGFAVSASLTAVNPITPSVTTYDTGSGNYTVTAYNTLTIELWGGGATGGYGDAGTVGTGINGNATTVSTYSLTAGGGLRSASTFASGTQLGGVGGTATGGNTTNTAGGTAENSISISQSGKGGNSPNGGMGGARVTGVGTPATWRVGQAGAAPGGGGSGGVFFTGTNYSPYPSAGAGAYVKHVFTAGNPGAPAVAANIAYAVAALKTANANMGNGAPGRVRFTVA